MKSLIIYHSVYNNNTEKIAIAIAGKINAELISLKNPRKVNMDRYDLIGFGSGVYKESMSLQLFNYVEKLNLKGKRIFVFSTSGVGMSFYNKKLINLLESKGAKCIGSFACKGRFTSRDFSNNKIFEIMSKFADGHPNNKDIEKAEKFIAHVVDQGKGLF